MPFKLFKKRARRSNFVPVAVEDERGRLHLCTHDRYEHSCHCRIGRTHDYEEVVL